MFYVKRRWIDSFQRSTAKEELEKHIKSFRWRENAQFTSAGMYLRDLLLQILLAQSKTTDKELPRGITRATCGWLVRGIITKTVTMKQWFQVEVGVDVVIHLLRFFYSNLDLEPLVVTEANLGKVYSLTIVI
jgi:hypothetical protein